MLIEQELDQVIRERHARYRHEAYRPPRVTRIRLWKRRQPNRPAT
ncbi:MAG TPA: hypothetical protein VD767_11020 [Thermomicrobiales bacterium]|nr:hypothetical protein [Thermomicrobiales bacterium]